MTISEKTFLVKSFGCKVSQYDGAKLGEKLQTLGLRHANDDETPDLFVLNGCAVTGRASQKVRQAVRSAKRAWPSTLVVLAGCEARLIERKQDGECESLEVDGILPSMDDENIRRLLEKFNFIVSNIKLTETAEGVFGDGFDRTRRFLKIQDGCNQFCSYCIVPYLRGRETSRPQAEVIAEAYKAVGAGYKEIVVTGIHAGRYEFGLVPLLRELARIQNLERIRLSSIEPLEVDDELIHWLTSEPKACRHLHLPLQSGCDEILKAMRRPYNTLDFAKLVGRLREKIPDIGIGTDLIVGFPGETDDFFTQTLKFLEKTAFSRIHIFRYSQRNGTPAATMPNQISNKVKQERAEAVHTVWKKSADAFHRSFLGRDLEVLWENSKKGFWHGFTSHYVPCRISCKDNLHNKITRAHVVKADSEFCTLEAVKEL